MAAALRDGRRFPSLPPMSSICPRRVIAGTSAGASRPSAADARARRGHWPPAWRSSLSCPILSTAYWAFTACLQAAWI